MTLICVWRVLQSVRIAVSTVNSFFGERNPKWVKFTCSTCHHGDDVLGAWSVFGGFRGFDRAMKRFDDSDRDGVATARWITSAEGDTEAEFQEIL